MIATVSIFTQYVCYCSGCIVFKLRRYLSMVDYVCYLYSLCLVFGITMDSNNEAQTGWMEGGGVVYYQLSTVLIPPTGEYPAPTLCCVWV